jgi:type IV pilus assembly protein PilP
MRAWMKPIMVLAVTLALAGCSYRDYADLEGFKDELRQRPKPPTTPLPEFMPYQAFAYGAANMRSPFEPPQRVQPVDPARAKSDVKPDPNRVRQYLEQFTIAQLKMVGTLSREAALFGLIEDPSGGVHRIATGDFMGTDHGRVQAIGGNRIELVEIVADGTGGWIERARTVSLGGREQ